MRENILFSPDHVRNVAITTLIDGARRKANPTSKTERVSGAGFSWRGYDYVSDIQRRNSGRITAYGSTHKLNTGTLWEKGEPGFVLRYLHALEVTEGEEKVILQVASLEEFEAHMEEDDFGQPIEVRDSVDTLYLVRNGMVFSEGAVPASEKDRLAKLFNL